MSELIQENDNRATIRWKLLTGASALALTAYVMSPVAAQADDAGRPLIWLEVGGGLDRLRDNQEIYAPPFLALEPAQFSSPLKALQPPRYGMETDGAISFRPEDSKWIFSASIRYGRSGSKNHLHQQSYPLPYSKYGYFTSYGVAHTTSAVKNPFAAQFIDAQSKNSESHAILDFQVGHDVGLGLFGHESTSSLNLGVRIAQFKSRSLASLREDPDWAFHVYHLTVGFRPYFYEKLTFLHQPYHSYAGQFEAERSFHGIGPSLTWKSSVPFAGNTQDGALALDWGLNASLLFGRQVTRTQHQTTGKFHPAGVGPLGGLNPGPLNTLYQYSTSHIRSKNVTVPNIGGFAGISYNYSSAKISLGYRADFFFNAIDGGIDAAKKENRGFFGPYASISIGIGD